jgi:hypothetical protein
VGNKKQSTLPSAVFNDRNAFVHLTVVYKTTFEISCTYRYERKCDDNGYKKSSFFVIFGIFFASFPRKILLASLYLSNREQKERERGK